MSRRWTALLLHAVALLVLLVHGQAGGHAPPLGGTGATPAGGLALPGCQEKCGNITIPYPFGIGEKCSLPGFELQCNRTSTGEILHTDGADPVVDISLFPAKVRILVNPFSTCHLSDNQTADPLKSDYLYIGRSFAFSSTDNLLTVLGCNNLAYVPDKALGCVSLCGPQGLDSVVDYGTCSGIGCCQAPLPHGLRDFYTRLSHLNLSRALYSRGCRGIYECHGKYYLEISTVRAEATLKSRFCGSSFLAEKGSYTFRKADADMDISNRTYPVVLDWSIGTQYDSQTCEQAQANKTTYACRSSNSVCFNSTATGFGYLCNCSVGFQGNPYLQDGCQDIDECLNPQACKVDRECTNSIGHYSCDCPHGTIDNGTNSPCIPINFGAKDRNSNKTTLGIALGFSISFGLLLLLAGCTIIFNKAQKRKEKQHRLRFFKKNHDMLLKQQLISCEGENIIERVRFFPCSVLSKATNNFDRSCIVGKGGHGTVYKALINLRVVAIKMSKVTTQREVEEFLNEVILLSQVNHRNIVKFIGCCLETEVPLIVYEFISNGTLFDRLHIQNEENLLPWFDRLRIATEITSALAYLHSAANVSIFHRDIKTSNILLDERLSAKISDFGASKFVTFNQTHITTNVQGTWGYLDPEYLQTCQLTEKTDVYSLGVILVELLTGQNPTSRLRSREEGSPISSFILAMKENRLLQVVDHSIIKDINAEEVNIFARLAMACLSINGKDRPTMKNILAILESLMNENKIRSARSIPEKQSEFQTQLPDMSVLFNTSSTTSDWSLQMHASSGYASLQ